MKTTSEAACERFFRENNLAFQPLAAGATPRPDYLVTVGALAFMVEVKEIAEDDHFATGPGAGGSRTIGDHIRKKIREARPQIQYGARRGFPSLLLVYNNLDPMHAFDTEDHDFITAMYGEYTLCLDRETGRTVDAYHGRNHALAVAKNTSFSAIGRLWPSCEKMHVTLFDNMFARWKMPYEHLPSCFRVIRFTLSTNP
jgi:hypothetical protein